jgi:2-haloacid dehalogenase
MVLISVVIGIYLDFSNFTRRSLAHAVAESGVSLTDGQTDELMQSYDSLSTFADVAPMLKKLSKRSEISKKVIFSNGTHAMVSSSVKNSADLSPHADAFDAIVSVEDVRKFKPAPETYTHLAQSVGKDPDDKKSMAEIWLVSGNPFDVVGGRAVGMNAAWVDRAGNGWQDSMMPGAWNGPSAIVRSLEEVVDVVMEAAGTR